MSLKNPRVSQSPYAVLSVVCLLVYSAGFPRNTFKFNECHKKRPAVEEAIPPLKSRLEDFEDAMSFRSGKAES